MVATKNTNNNSMGMLAHLLGLFVGFLGPLIIFLTIEDKKGKVYENARHALNFQISVIIYAFVGGLLSIIIIGIFLLIALGILVLVTSIMGAVKANEGGVYSYPLEIQFIK